MTRWLKNYAKDERLSESEFAPFESPLCQYCRTALDLWGSKKDRAEAGDGRPSRGYPETLLLKTESRLVERVGMGCRLCSMIYDSFEGQLGYWTEGGARIGGITSIQEGDPEVWAYIRAWRKYGPADSNYRNTDLCIHRFKPFNDMRFKVVLHPVDERQCTGCSEGAPFDICAPLAPPWDLIDSWLKECINSHPGPCNLSPTAFLPSRIINVGTMLTPTLRMELRDEIPVGSRYLTLSHCWGGVVPKRLLLNNHEGFRSSIPMHDLSKTFQDAILVTRRLGVQYIWIDSLCIIQDSAEDWQAEAAMMGQVYQSGFCNLAAIAATDGNQGLFLDKLPFVQTPIEIDGSRDLWHLNEVSSAHWESAINFSSLSRRGWVFQERFLSSRVIYFGRAKIYWECGQKSCCELRDSLTTKDVMFTSRSWTNQSKSKWQNFVSGTGTWAKDEAVEIWMNIISLYATNSAFTYQTDKLIAIGGLASRVQKKTQSRYFAGLWEHNLLAQLMWDVDAGPIYNDVNSEYVAPSWSWASVNVPITRNMTRKVNYNPVHVVDVTEINIELVTDNPFGQVKGGFLSLEGRLGVTEALYKNKDQVWSSERLNGLEVIWDRKDDTPEQDGQRWYLLAIEEQRSEEVREGAGLVLKVVPDAVGVFKRVGFFQYYTRSGGKDELYASQEEFDSSTLARELHTGREKDGKLLYLVKII